MSHEYVVNIKTFSSRSSTESDSTTEIGAVGSSVRVALNRSMNVFRHKLGLKTDYKLAVGQKITIDLIRVK